MFIIQSHAGTRSNSTFKLFSSRRFFCAAITTLLFAAFALVMLARPQQANAPTKKNTTKHSDEEDGRKTFESVCATCHGLDGKGGERGPNVATRAEVQRLSDGETLRILRAGIPAAGMPAFGALGLPKIKAVMGYLRVLQGGSKPVSIRGDAQSGKLFFFGKAGCAKCHMINGAGGFLGADLSSYGSNVSIEDMRAAITDPNRDLEPTERTVLVTTRDGRQFTGIARNEDNFSLQLQTLEGAFHLFAKADLEHIEYRPKSLMPSDYGSVLSASELDDLVSFLLQTAQTGKQTQSSATKSKRGDEDD
jgi:putative heme-binding domain-containing protein